MRKSLFLTLCLILSPALALAQRPDFSPEVRSFIGVDVPVLALTNVTVIDGMGTPSRAGQTIVIEGDRIAAVGPVGEVGIPDGAEVMDLSGHTVLPGIIGLHDHTYYTAQFDESSPRLYLAEALPRRGSTSPPASRRFVPPGVGIRLRTSTSSTPLPKARRPAPRCLSPGRI